MKLVKDVTPAEIVDLGFPVLMQTPRVLFARGSFHVAIHGVSGGKPHGIVVSKERPPLPGWHQPPIWSVVFSSEAPAALLIALLQQLAAGGAP